MIASRESDHKMIISSLFAPGVDDDARSGDVGQCAAERQCPKACVCQGTVVDCSGRKLKQIPTDLPAYATEL